MWSGIMFIVFTCFVVYPASVGPAIVLHRRSASAPVKQAIETFYHPLLFACDRLPVFGNLIFAYAEWWRPKE